LNRGFLQMLERNNANKGFSMVELIIVILLVGITGVVVIARLMSPATFNELAARDGLLTVIRAAQQASLGRSTVTFEINQVADDWVFEARAGGTPVQTIEIPMSGVVLETGSAIASGSTCATAYDTAVAADFELAFSSKGDLTQFTNNTTTELVDAAFNGVRICVNDSVEFSVCVSPAGYAYAGNCDD